MRCHINTGVRPLMAAAVHGRLADVSALLSLGADPTATLPNGQSAADLAALRGHDEVVELLQACAAEAAKLQETEAATAALSHYQQNAQADEVRVDVGWCHPSTLSKHLCTCKLLTQ